MMQRILIIDDEKTIRDGIMMAFDGVYRMSAYPDAEKALAFMETETPDLVILDIGLPGMSGIDALKKIKTENPDMLVIMVTAYEDVGTVVSAMKAGAYDYVVKPLHMDSLEVTIGNALEYGIVICRQREHIIINGILAVMAEHIFKTLGHALFQIIGFSGIFHNIVKMPLVVSHRRYVQHDLVVALKQCRVATEFIANSVSGRIDPFDLAARKGQ